MALTKAQVREILSAAGVDREHMSDAVDKIIDGHLASINVLREEVDKYKSDAEKLSTVEKELNDLKAMGDGGYKEKYEKEHKAFEDYKADVTAKESKAAKEKAVRAYFESKNITGSNLDLAMRGCGEEMAALVMDGDKIKDTTSLDALIDGAYKSLVYTEHTQGANPATPPTNSGGAKLTRADIYKKDDKGRYVMSTADRQKALAANPELLN